MNVKKIGLCFVALLILGSAGCNKNSANQANLGQLILTTQVNADNTPVAELSTFVNNAPKIYLSAEINNAKKGDRVDVTWHYLSKNLIITTETFTGKRTTDHPYDFVGGRSPMTSWLVSTITLKDISWPTGDYEVAITINRRDTQKIGFTIVTEKDFDVAYKKAFVKNIWLGKEIDAQSQIVSPSTNFNQDDSQIYAVALLHNVPNGTHFKATWKLLETGQVLSSFNTDFSGSGYIPFSFGLEEIGRTIWLKGNYTFSLYVDNVLVATKNFVIN